MNAKFTLSAALLLSATAAFAQPTITSSNNPVAGLTEQFHYGSTYAPGPAGASQTWDFSGQSFNASSGPESYAACGSTNACASYPGSNLVGTSNGADAYYKVTSTSYAFTGINTNSSSGSVLFSDPEDLMHYPFTYNNSFVDPWAATINNAGVTFYRKGVDSVTADGWGTLKTPAGTYTNTLRTKQISTYRDSANLAGTPFIISYKVIIYSWRDAAHKDVLYGTSSLTTTSQGSSNTSFSSSYVDGQVTAVPHAISGLMDWKIFPNPVKGSAQITISATANATAEMLLTDMTGRSVLPVPAMSLSAGDNKFSIPTNCLAAGIYMLRLTIDGKSDVRRIVISE